MSRGRFSRSLYKLPGFRRQPGRERVIDWLDSVIYMIEEKREALQYRKRQVEEARDRIRDKEEDTEEVSSPYESRLDSALKRIEQLEKSRKRYKKIEEENVNPDEEDEEDKDDEYYQYGGPLRRRIGLRGSPRR